MLTTYRASHSRRHSSRHLRRTSQRRRRHRRGTTSTTRGHITTVQRHHNRPYQRTHPHTQLQHLLPNNNLQKNDNSDLHIEPQHKHKLKHNYQTKHQLCTDLSLLIYRKGRTSLSAFVKVIVSPISSRLTTNSSPTSTSSSSSSSYSSDAADRLTY